MTDSELEAAVVEFLERRQTEPALTPEGFAEGRAGGDPGLLAAIRTALDVENLFPSEPRVPRWIGSYQVLGEIGRGGMGIVYRVERDQEVFALKLLPLAPLVGPRMLDRFRREAETLSHLSHPGIVRVHESGMHDEMPYLVMDLVEGEPLQLIAPSLTIAQSAELIETLSETVHAAHLCGVLHRDLKPQNVMVRGDGTPVLLDFGLSVADDFPTLTATGEILGTPRYMAPEQVLGMEADARTDVYALGLILYELVTGCPAHKEQSRETLLDAVRCGRVPPARKINRSIPRELEKILLVALARDPNRRYPDAARLADDLRRFLQGEAVAARPPSRAIRSLEWARAHPGRTWTGAIIVLASILVGWGWLRPASEIPPATLEQAFQHLDQATTFWIEGDPTAAKREVARSLELNPREPTARALNAHLSGKKRAPRGSPCFHAAREGMSLYEEGEFAQAMARLRSCPEGGLRGGFLAALMGLCAAEQGDLPDALEELTSATRLLPPATKLFVKLGHVCERLGRFGDAARAYSRASELAPDSTEIWVDLANVHLSQRNLEAGFRAISVAESLSATEEPRMMRIRAGLETHAGNGEKARLLLGRVLERKPDDTAAQYQLAYSLDMDHQVRDAEKAYLRVLEIQPHHATTLMCLANLYSGASRGQCRGCDRAYKDHPECLDLDKAAEYLLRCIEQDRGRTDWIMSSLLGIALRLDQRGRVVDLLTRLTVDAEKTPSILRMEEMLRRLRLVEGPRH